jgi:hypothetical protein
VHWIPPAEYLLGRVGHRNPPGTVLRRAGQLAAPAVFGTVDEIVASPRLLPVLLLALLWLFGHDPGRHAAWRALSARAIADGNPALDYIGIGGPTPLRRMELRSYYAAWFHPICTGTASPVRFLEWALTFGSDGSKIASAGHAGGISRKESAGRSAGFGSNRG